MTDLLLAQSQERLSRESLERAVRACRDSQGPLGEYLVRSGLVSESALRGALLRHTCEAIVDLVSEEESWEWIEHRGKGYSPALTFSPADVFSGLHALETPSEVDELRKLLGSCTLRGQRAFAIARDLSDRTPVAHVGCDDLGVDVLFDLAEQAHELMTLGSLVPARGIVYVFEQFACAAWLGSSYLHVIVDSDDMAFSRLVSQLVSINP
jgi:hypothetical protein